MQYYGLKNEKKGEIDCSYGKFIRTLLKEYNALKEIIDSSWFTKVNWFFDTEQIKSWLLFQFNSSKTHFNLVQIK